MDHNTYKQHNRLPKLLRQDVQKEARLYRNHIDFQNSSFEHYRVAVVYGMLDKYCEHMTDNNDIRWKTNDAHLKAVRYAVTFSDDYQYWLRRNRAEVKLFNNGAYNTDAMWDKDYYCTSAYVKTLSEDIVDIILEESYDGEYLISGIEYYLINECFRKPPARYYESRTFYFYHEKLFGEADKIERKKPSHRFDDTYKCWKSKKAILYYLKIYIGENILYKIGITSQTVNKRYCASDLKMIRVLHSEEHETGYAAYEKEQMLIKRNLEHRYSGLSRVLKSVGNTELFTKDILNLDRGLTHIP